MMQHIPLQDLYNKDNRYRAKLINSLSGFKSANVIGTCDNIGNTNLAIFSSVVHLGASPALVGFIMRPDTVPRDTLNNILLTKHYTINQVSSTFWQQAHQTSARYPPNHSEFSETDLSVSFIDGHQAPFVEQSLVKYAVVLKEIIPIASNNTQFVIGEITDILCQQSAIKADGYLDLESLNTVCVSSLDSYHITQHLGRLSYAKPETPLTPLTIDGERGTTQ
ncbi:flavin reductase [Colwellia asteriadis]|uniref:Flavin reductase n=2 Tax=Colwellia asteriadis TaxID=517723 RepID=A0ABP3WK46_9GAMM